MSYVSILLSGSKVNWTVCKIITSQLWPTIVCGDVVHQVTISRTVVARHALFVCLRYHPVGVGRWSLETLEGFVRTGSGVNCTTNMSAYVSGDQRKRPQILYNCYASNWYVYISMSSDNLIVAITAQAQTFPLRQDSIFLHLMWGRSENSWTLLNILYTLGPNEYPDWCPYSKS